MFIHFNLQFISTTIFQLAKFCGYEINQRYIISTEGIWAASNGGVYFYDILTNNSFKTSSKSSGLNGTELTAVGIDNYEKFGSEV